jgi:5'-nucleotidase
MSVERTILVDVDGVLADLEPHFARVWAARFPSRALPLETERRHAKIANDLPAAFRDDARRIIAEAGFYRSLPPVTGAVAGFQELAKTFSDVWLCTSPLREFWHSVPEKYEWVEAHLGRRWTERIVLTRDKSLVRGDILIDDNPELRGLDKASWELVLFDAPYNRHVSNLRRLTWGNWRAVLLG